MRFCILIKLLFVAGMALFILSGCGISGSDDRIDASSTHREDNEHIHTQVRTTYGPGLGPMMHSLSLRQFDTVSDIAKHPDDLPPALTPREPQTIKIAVTAKEVVSEIAPNVTYLYWTFNETVPGPFLRVMEGDTVEITLTNDQSSAHNHSIDLHAVNGPDGGADDTQVAPGETKTITFKALNPGIYKYHCATANVPTHVTNGMYGLILVEPKDGLPPVDKEFYIMQGEFYTKDQAGTPGYQAFNANKMLDEKPDYVVLNGRTYALTDFPAEASVGDKIRMYVGNGGVALSSNFHVVGEIFDTVYPEGGTVINKNVQTTAIPAGGASIVEFTVDVPATYNLVDHALARIEKGAWGWLNVTGDENLAVYRTQRQDR